MQHINLPCDLKKVGNIFKKNGFKAYLVGGAVRDMLLKKEGHDWDLATNATPKQVMSIFHRVIPTGIAHGTVTIHIFGHEIETTTFRTESDYTDGRHPDSVSYAATIEEDLSRRDFTMNAIASDLETGGIIDPFNGRSDIKNRIIRTVGSPLDRFSEDGLRPVRAIRFCGQLGFTIEEETLKALQDKNVLERTSKISVERFRDEFCKMLSVSKPSVCLKLLEESGIMDIFIPEFRPCRNCLQRDGRGFHEFDVADHIFYACDGGPKDNLIVRLAAFYHDIGKPACKKEEVSNGVPLIHFHNHESVSARIAKTSMTHLKFSNEYINAVSHLVKEHMFYYEPTWSDAAVRRFIIRIGEQNLDNIIDLRLADIYGMHNCPIKEGSPSWNLLVELKTRVQKVLEEKSVLTLKNLAVNGNDLINIGIPHGKDVGIILNELLNTVIDSPSMNERDKLLNLAKNIYDSHL